MTSALRVSLGPKEDEVRDVAVCNCTQGGETAKCRSQVWMVPDAERGVLQHEHLLRQDVVRAKAELVEGELEYLRVGLRLLDLGGARFSGKLGLE